MTDHHGLNELKGIQVMCHHGHQAQPGNRFGRMFNLPPLYTDPAALERLGQQDGPMKAEEKLPTTTVPVGQVFFGQFVDHDITLDITSSLDSVAEPEETPNVRTPTLDLDNVYGLGPEAHPYLFEDKESGGAGEEKPFKGVKLLTGEDDLSRSADGTAIIGDPRNDENRIVSQLQLAMIRFHNNVVAAQGVTPETDTERKALYKKVRELVTWHYQWVVINDFLVKMCGQAVVADILGHGRRFYCVHGETPFIPIEFSVAAYRFGHSMIPQSLKIRRDGAEQDLFGEVLGAGFKPVSGPEAIVEWSQLVDTGQSYSVQMADQLDSKLAGILLALPFIKNGEKSLATRNLLRGQTFLLPSGESVASAMERPPAEIDRVSQRAQELAGETVDLSNGTPLWFYILVEAATIGRETSPNRFDPREGLGPIGARIVAETLIGLVELDPRSYLGKNRNWTPEDGVGVATLADMLTYLPG